MLFCADMSTTVLNPLRTEDLYIRASAVLFCADISTTVLKGSKVR